MRNPELDRLKAAQQSLFEQKQVAFDKYVSVRDEASRAHDAMEAAWQERVHARDVMNREFEAKRAAYEHHDTVWKEYRHIRDKNNYEIEYLKREADAEHAAMKECFDRASDAYNYGDKASAPAYAAYGHEHRDRRDSLNSAISELIAEVKEAKAYAEAHAPKVDSSDFNHAKAEFERAKTHHESAQAEFNRLRAERDRLKAEFDRLQAEFKRAQEAFRTKLDEVKRARAAEKDSAISKVNMTLVRSNTHYLGTLFGQNAKIVPHQDGTTHIFFGGLHPAGDGIGHGHAVIDPNGNVTYLRDAWQDHDDYLIDNASRREDNTHKI